MFPLIFKSNMLKFNDSSAAKGKQFGEATLSGHASQDYLEQIPDGTI